MARKGRPHPSLVTPPAAPGPVRAAVPLFDPPPMALLATLSSATGPAAPGKRWRVAVGLYAEQLAQLAAQERDALQLALGRPGPDGLAVVREVAKAATLHRRALLAELAAVTHQWEVGHDR
jgi:hypothetical protein